MQKMCFSFLKRPTTLKGRRGGAGQGCMGKENCRNKIPVFCLYTQKSCKMTGSVSWLAPRELIGPPVFACNGFTNKGGFFLFAFSFNLFFPLI